MSKLKPAMALGKYIKDWPGLSIKEHYVGECVSLSEVLGQEPAFKTAFKAVYGTPLPKPNKRRKIKGGFAFWSGPGQYMLLLEGQNIDADLAVSKALNGTAYTTLQTDGWASIDITGPRTFDVLDRFIPLDLRRAQNDFAARTSAHHIAVIVLKFSETEIQLLTPRSTAQAFLQGLEHTVNNVVS